MIRGSKTKKVHDVGWEQIQQGRRVRLRLRDLIDALMLNPLPKKTPTK